MTNTSTPRAGIFRFLNLLAAFSLLLVAGAASAQNTATTIFVETGGLDTRSGTAPNVVSGQVYQGRVVGPLRTITRALELLDDPGYSNVTTISVAAGDYAEDVFIDNALYDVDGITFESRLEANNAATVVTIDGDIVFAGNNLTFGGGDANGFEIGGDSAGDGLPDDAPGGSGEEAFDVFNDTFNSSAAPDDLTRRNQATQAAIATAGNLIVFKGGTVQLVPGDVMYVPDADVLVVGGTATGSVVAQGSTDLYYNLNRNYPAGAELPATLTGGTSSLIVQLNADNTPGAGPQSPTTDPTDDEGESDLELRLPDGVTFTGDAAGEPDNFVFLYGDNDLEGDVTVSGQVDFFADSQSGFSLYDGSDETHYANFGDIIITSGGYADFTNDGALSQANSRVLFAPAPAIREVDSIDVDGTADIEGIVFRVLGDFDNDGVVLTDFDGDGFADTYLSLAGDEDAVFSPGPNFNIEYLAIGNDRFTESVDGQFEGDDKVVTFTDDVTINTQFGFFFVSDNAEAALGGEVVTLAGDDSFAIINGLVSSTELGAIEFAADDGSPQYIAGEGTFSNLVVSTIDPGSDWGPDLVVLPLGAFIIQSQFANFESGGDTNLEFTGTLALATAGINIVGEDFLGTANGADLSPAENAAQTAGVLVVLNDPNQETVIKSEPFAGTLNIEGTFNFEDEQFSLNYQGDVVGDYGDNPFEVGLEFDTENLVNLTANGSGIVDASGLPTLNPFSGTNKYNTDEGRIRGNLTVTSLDAAAGLTNLDIDEDGDFDDNQDDDGDGTELFTLVLPVDDVPDPTDDDANTVVDGMTLVGPGAEIALLSGSTLRLRGDATIDGYITGGSDGLEADLLIDADDDGVFEPGGDDVVANDASTLFLDDQATEGDGYIVLDTDRSSVNKDAAGIVINGNVSITDVTIGRNSTTALYDFQTDIVDANADDVLTLSGTDIYGNVILDGSMTLAGPGVTLTGDQDGIQDEEINNIVKVGGTLAMGEFDLNVEFEDKNNDTSSTDGERAIVDLTDATVTATTGYLYINSDTIDESTPTQSVRLTANGTELPNLWIDSPVDVIGSVRVTNAYVQSGDSFNTTPGDLDNADGIAIADDVTVLFNDGATGTPGLDYEMGINLRTLVGAQASNAALLVADALTRVGPDADNANVYTFGNTSAGIPARDSADPDLATAVGSIAEVGTFGLGQTTSWVRDLVFGSTANGGFLNLAGHRVYTLGDVDVDGSYAINNFQATGSCTSGGGSFVPVRGCATDPISEIGFAGGEDAELMNPSGETFWGQGVDLRIAKDEAEDIVSLTNRDGSDDGAPIVFDDVFDALQVASNPDVQFFGGADEILILQTGVLMAGIASEDLESDETYIRLDHENALNLSIGQGQDNGQGFVFAREDGSFIADDQAVEIDDDDSYISGNVRKRIANREDVNVLITTGTGDIEVAEIDVAPGRVIFPTGESLEDGDDSSYAPFVFDFESAGPGEEFGTRELSVTYIDESPGMNDSLPLADGTSGPGLIEGVADFSWRLQTVGAALGQDTQFNIEARSDEYVVTGSSDDIELVRRQTGNEDLNDYVAIGGDAEVFELDGDEGDDTIVVQESVEESFLGPQGTLVTFGLAVSTRPVANTPDSPTVPTEFAFHGNLPNPFNARTALSFDLPEAAEVTVEVFDVMGRRVLNVDNKALNAGAEQRIELDGSGLASGVYVFRMRAEGASQTWTQAGQITLAR